MRRTLADTYRYSDGFTNTDSYLYSTVTTTATATSLQPQALAPARALHEHGSHHHS